MLGAPQGIEKPFNIVEVPSLASAVQLLAALQERGICGVKVRVVSCDAGGTARPAARVGGSAVAPVTPVRAPGPAGASMASGTT